MTLQRKLWCHDFFCKCHCASSGEKTALSRCSGWGGRPKSFPQNMSKHLSVKKQPVSTSGWRQLPKHIPENRRVPGVQVWSVLHALRRRGVLVELPGRLLWDTGSSPDKLMVWQYLRGWCHIWFTINYFPVASWIWNHVGLRCYTPHV